MLTARLTQQMAFLAEVEKLKLVARQNLTLGDTRHENSAEHSWHVALMALVLGEHANDPVIDMLKVLKMLLIHDLVEIYAGDTALYDEAAGATQPARERACATKLFALLPHDQQTEFRALWDEFDARQTAAAQFAAAIDSLQPLANHLLTGVPTSDMEKPHESMVFDKKRHIAAGSTTLWACAVELIDQSVAAGLYEAETEDP